MRGFKALKSLLVSAALLQAAPSFAETLTNADIITLTEVGLADEAIVAKIKGTSNKFEMSTGNMVALKKKGVSGAVIAAMIAASSGAAVSNSATASIDSPDPLVPHPSGIYLLAGAAQTAKMVKIDPTTSNQTKTGGFLGYALTGGLASMSFKAVIPNASARVKTSNGTPTFYFYFDESNRSLSNGAGGFWLSGSASMVTSPNEFSLVRFDTKKDRREAKVGSFNIAGAKAGVMDKDRIEFTYELVTTGVYKVTSQASLPSGEYGFIYSTSAGSGPGMAGVGATTSRIFDFSVTP